MVQGPIQVERPIPNRRDAVSMRKYMSVKEFVERGFLQEVNRRVLHPCGVELLIHEWGGEFEFAGVRDARDDPEGVVFTDSEPPDWWKRDQVNDEWNKHADIRANLLGEQTVQSCPEPGE